ncbi:MAG: hypothetical protein ACXV6K_08835 [Halobacteriota archaeon]
MPGIIGVAVARGYHYQGGVSAFGLAVMAGLIAAMASIALALIIASFAKNDTQAMLSGTVLAVPLGSRPECLCRYRGSSSANLWANLYVIGSAHVDACGLRSRVGPELWKRTKQRWRL